MKKIPTVFVIDRITHCATDVVQAQWVVDGEGVATVKYDGTACRIADGVLQRRFNVKRGKTPPSGWIACEPQADPVTGHWPGWLPVDAGDPACRWHVEAFDKSLEDGTYELVGPCVQKGRYGLTTHALWRHGCEVVVVERTREAVKAWLENHDQEGLVFHHPDGRMAKIRRKDFGLGW